MILSVDKPSGKLILLAVLTAGYLSAAAQRKKAPYSARVNEPVVFVDTALARAGIRSFQELGFRSNEAGGLDTAWEKAYRLDAQGRPEALVHYIYDAPPPELPGAPGIRGYSSSLRSVTKTTYQYDAAGSIIAILEYEGLMGNTKDVLVARLRMQLRRSRSGKDGKALVNSAATEAALNRFVDSLRLATPADPWLQVRERQFRYDSSGNILRTWEPGIPYMISYDYEYDGQERVTLKRTTERATADSGDNPRSYSEEVHYTYAAGDEPESYCVYRKFRDSAGIAQDADLAVCRRFHYNADGDVDTMQLWNSVRRETQVSSYQGHFRTALTVLNNGTDTTSYTTFTYGVGRRLAVERTFEFRGNFRRTQKETVYTYGAQGLLAGKLVRSIDRLQPGNNGITLSLFFYGDPEADARTAERKEELERELRAVHDSKLRKRSGPGTEGRRH